MIAPGVLQMLRCPQDRSQLTMAEASLVDRVNKAIGAGTAANLGGDRLERRVDGGLVREAGDLFYPVIDGIPVLLPSEAIELATLSD